MEANPGEAGCLQAGAQTFRQTARTAEPDSRQLRRRRSLAQRRRAHALIGGGAEDVQALRLSFTSEAVVESEAQCAGPRMNQS